jgi:hypothetical protein
VAEFRFSRHADGGPANGFDLGNLTLVGNRDTVTSAGRRPDQSMMIYVAISDLLDGIRHLLKSGRGTFRFVGADSSFQLAFTLRRGQLTTRHNGADVDTSPVADLVAALWTAAHDFAVDPANTLPPDDAAGNDLAASLAKFEPLAH